MTFAGDPAQAGYNVFVAFDYGTSYAAPLAALTFTRMARVTLSRADYYRLLVAIAPEGI